ncbi:MAG: protein phosphatase 2C domain-containing protein [Synergistaceae bacterium]|nr:protein phosphatase 2C domain-containing protein [Synergistaceae bacterium]
MNVAFMTHRGSVRPQNQDALQIAGDLRTGDMDRPELRELEAFRMPLLLSVADGLGGYSGGERAAEILVRALAAGSGRFTPELDPDADERLLRDLLNAAVEEIRALTLRDPSLSDMGSTIAGLVIRERSVLAFNCGDCRAYRFFAGGEEEKLTHDHSLVQALRDSGEITEEEMRSHPRKNVVTSAVAADVFGEFELYAKPVSRTPGDAFFICSDGVWEALPLSDLTRFMQDPSPDAPGRFFDDLIAAGCRDNVSFIRVC